MAIVKKGSALTSGIGQLQPGYVIENDGYGLLTCRAEYIYGNHETFLGGSIRDEPFEGDGRLYGHKFNFSRISLERTKIVIDYVGIDHTQPDSASGWTRPQTTGSNGLSTEKIETHPNFFEKTVGTNTGGDTAIAGKFSDLTQSSLIVGKGINYMEGFNGALFEPSTSTSQVGKFVGFFRQDKPQFYGKTSYLAPTTVFSGTVYTDSASNAQAFKKKIGVAVNSNDLGISGAPALVPTEYGSAWNGANGPQLLVSKADIENFGNLWKIQYEVRFSREGFPKIVYPEIA